MLTNDLLELRDGTSSYIMNHLTYLIPITAALVPFTLLSLRLFVYYLIFLLIYSVVGVFVGLKIYPKHKNNIRIVRTKVLLSATIVMSYMWPYALYIWNSLEGSVPEYEKIKFLYNQSGKG